MTEEYRDWINSLKDRAGRARIQMRIDRLAHGNPGKGRNLTGSVSELKIDFGPGYRVYYGRDGKAIIILLGGGSKRRQAADITAAIDRWKRYKQTKANNGTDA